MKKELLKLKYLTDQEKSIKILSSVIMKGNIPNAFLFSGINGSGKFSVACYFAMACNCKKSEINHINSLLYCGECNSCKKISRECHPDIFIIEPEGKFIKISQIRNLCEKLMLKPFEAFIRVVIISDIHKINKEAGNALLKVLEDPPVHTVFILISESITDLLPTIVSRCQHIRFKPVSMKNIKNYLIQKNNTVSEEASLIAGMSNGSIMKAIEMDKKKWKTNRLWLLNEIGTLSRRSTNYLLFLAEKLSKDNHDLLETLNIIQTFFRDLIVQKYCPEQLVNKDLSESIKKLSKKNSIQSLLSKLESIQLTHKALHSNVNKRLSMEMLIMELSKE